MNVTIIHIKTDTKIRDEARKVAEEYGLSLTGLVNVVLRQIAKTKHLTVNLNDEEPSEYLLKEMKQAKADREAGRASPIFHSAKEMEEWIEKQNV
jgi:addiction module RelB/DinJ family antitoxin